MMTEEKTAELDEAGLLAANAELESMSAPERVGWAAGLFGQTLVMTSSFGAQAAVMLHLVTRQIPDIPVIFIDTGYLFPETYRFAEELRQKLNLNIVKYRGQSTSAEQEALYGKLWEQGKEGLARYNLINKVEPMNRAVTETGAKAWLAGLRRQQASTREKLPVLLRQNRIFKIHPIVDWTDRDIYLYLHRHGLPYHPLWHDGFVSIGDWHSTSRLVDGMKEEETRFNGVKRECGLHEISGNLDFQI